jgi:hypothetical protein
MTLKLGILMLLVAGFGQGDGGICDNPKATPLSDESTKVLGA